MSGKNFNSEIYNLVVANGTIDDNFANISFTTEEFEGFMVDFVKYVQHYLNDIRTDAIEGGTYMGEDIPSSVIISEINQCIWIEE